ncbi:MAG: DUF937 domain-containing protein [Oscillatoriophycideae cyanobacterium NC_groundwater_1537_Pr4_S-0.65um_50_18]|nr:DUF937 domain-containing protein [Oscillatoriophycideae cyanobacterium NC_groundwater_1537_Pr4_S-0.65um_50_18]
MGLFFEILKAINNPEQQGNLDQLGSIMNTVQQVGATRGINASTLQTVLSTLSGMIRPALQQSATSPSSLENLVTQLGSGNSGTALLASFLTPQLQQQMVQAIAQKTGLSASTLQALLPGVIASAIGFLGMGASKPGVGGSNSVLSAFLDGDGDTDLGDVFKFSGRLLSAPR